MSDYTMSLYWIVKNKNTDRTKTLDEQIDIANQFIFDFDFPIWNETYRTTFERKLINHFLMYEIGVESLNMFKYFLNERLNLIMPYYNRIYETTINDYDYLNNYNLTETQDATAEQTDTIISNQTGNTTGNQTTNDVLESESNSEQNADNKSTTINSDFPQATFNVGVDYASGSSETTEDNKLTGTETNNSTNNSTVNNTSTLIQNVSNNNESKKIDNFLNKKTGNTISLTELLMEYRNSIINIESDIFKELKDLFMLVF
jgi:hypothetical protein